MATAAKEEQLALGWAVSVLAIVVRKLGLLCRQGQRFAFFALGFGVWEPP